MKESFKTGKEGRKEGRKEGKKERKTFNCISQEKFLPYLLALIYTISLIYLFSRSID